tara:strand:+ start:154 stop:354 length:201 start_codon:yes stop_codon:yes gene_type:complete
LTLNETKLKFVGGSHNPLTLYYTPIETLQYFGYHLFFTNTTKRIEDENGAKNSIVNIKTLWFVTLG